MFNLFRRLIASSRYKPSVTGRRVRLRMESLEERCVPATFVPGSIQGQDGWSGGTIAIPATVDQAVAQPTVNARAGVGSWRVSNSTINGGFNGNFAGWPFSPGLAVTAGQPSSGAGADRFAATFYFKAANTVADGSNIEVDLGSSAGNDRNTFLAITNDTDGDGGLQLRVSEPDGVTGNFKPTQIIATGLSRTAFHRIDIVANFFNGNGNDTFQVTLDGVVLTNPLTSGTTFGTFEGFRNGIMSPYVLSNRLFWRSGAAPSAFDASFADNAAQGFYFDDVSYRASTQANPTVLLASYTARFESSTPGSGSAFAVATGPGARPQLNVYNANGTLRFNIVPYDAAVKGGVRVATGDVTGDGAEDIITGAGPGARRVVKVFDGASGALVRAFLATPAGAVGGVFLAAGDVNGDGRADIVVSAGQGDSPKVKVFDGATGALFRSFFASPKSFKGGVTVAAGDVNGDGRADVITGVGQRVKVFDGVSGVLIRSVVSSTPGATGIFVAAGDVNDDFKADLIVGAGQGGKPQVRIFDAASGALIRNFLALAPGYKGGVSVATEDVNGDGRADILAGGQGLTRAFNGLNPTVLLLNFLAFAPGFKHNVMVG